MNRHLRLLYIIPLFLLFSASAAQAGKDPNMVKAGVSYIWLSEYDSQGIMFSNSFSHHFSDRFAVGLNLGLASGSRYDDVKEIYSIKNAFYMGNLEASFDVMNNESVAFRLGGGVGARHRAEINSNSEDGTVDGSVKHIKTSDVGFNGFIENDFNILRNGVAGGRVGYFYYKSGTSVLSIGLHLGFKF
ncbi:hypothetical protein [uncultured Pontibacter sp.]|uniref:hypothetical protein n=1 Tax=uncultured Pontibacter sp. TaxID=453356 RepID=UPI0026302336|nr:hypothetical protein [uncultured Pontibacter sp.]